MIVHINHISQTKSKSGKPSQLGELVSLVTGSLVNFVEDGVLDASLAPSLRIHLDWIQYRTNFREPVIVRRTTTLRESRGRWPRSRSICGRPIPRGCRSSSGTR